MARRHSHNSTRRRRRGRFGPLFKLLCLVAVVVALTVGATVFFRVEQVVVSGNVRYTEEEIIAASGIQTGDNLYALNKNSISQKLRTQLPYIGELTIRRALPSTIVITVTEWEAVAQIAVPSAQEGEEAIREMTPEPDGEEDSGGEPFAPPVVSDRPWLINIKGKLLEPGSGGDVITVTGITPLDARAGVGVTVPPSQQAELEALKNFLTALEETGKRGEFSSVALEGTYMVLRYADRFDVKMSLNADVYYELQRMEAIRLDLENTRGPEVAGAIDLTQERGATYSPA